MLQPDATMLASAPSDLTDAAPAAASTLDRALSVCTTAALFAGLSVAMLALMATPGQPLDILLHSGGCPVGV